MEYRLTHRGRSAEVKTTSTGRVVGYMQEGHGVVNPDEVNYELSIENAKTLLDSLVKAGYASKEEEQDNTFGGGLDG